MNQSFYSKEPKRRFMSRRELLFSAGEGIGGIALACLLNQDRLLAADGNTGFSCGNSSEIQSPFSPKQPHFKPRAKAVISLFMDGGVSHLDTFDPKPALDKYHGQPLPGERDVQVQQGFPGPIMRSPYKFKQYGQSGIPVSELFPHMATCVDDLAFIRSGQGRSNDHSISHFEWNTGSLLVGYPSLGAWVTYGLGSANQNLPAFVVVYDHRGGPYNGPSNWGAGFLPASYQGTVFRSLGDPILDLAPPPGYVTPEQQRTRLDHLGWLNHEHEKKHPGSSELAARIASYELAYRMQGCAPQTVDFSDESDETKRLYGLDHPITEPFGRQCLMARRLVERGVRFVQLFSGAYVNSNVDTWDAHDSIVDNHGQHALEVDKPIAGLITDMKRRGLLDETLLLWHTEFGRMPISQRGVGRDHNPGAMTMWMAGAGIKGGQIIGSSDEFGYKVAEQPVSVNDFHATILHLLGMDHKRLTYLFNGRNMRLTDVHGELIPQIVS
ncbi:MAG: hypothetical protein QOJ99_3382 [Bryobacterales bacterium]|jgi:hypothetical protein|nr:hypothetical protein [Bryobacterales bacterium]